MRWVSVHFEYSVLLLAHSVLDLAAGPDTARLAIVGHFERDEILGQIRSEFGSWKPASGPASAPSIVPSGPPPVNDVGQVIYLVDQPDNEQATVLLAEPGVSFQDDDRCALDILAASMNGFGGTH
jgi:predicted Zn-dependent peptidase